MLAPLVVRVLGVLGSWQNCQPAPWREKLSRGKEGKGEEEEKGITGNNKLPKLPKLLI